MILKSIKLQNYRLYRHILIDFSHGSNSITVIKGNNGTGKTTLFNAISWCLFGIEKHVLDPNIGICNKKTMNTAMIGEEIEVSVEITFEDNGESFVCRRVNAFMKEEDGLKLLDSKFHVSKHDGTILRDYRAEKFIEQIIPKEILDYLLISDYINDIFHKKSFQSLFKPVNIIVNLQLYLIKNSIHRLNKMKNYFVSERRHINPGVELITTDVIDIHNSIKKVDENKKIAERDYDKILEKINDINESLKNHDPTIYEYHLKRNELEKLIKKNDEDLSVLNEELKKHILSYYPYILSQGSFNKFLALCEPSNDYDLDKIKQIIMEKDNFKTISKNLHEKINKIEEEQYKLKNELDRINDLLNSTDDIELIRVRDQYLYFNSLKHSKKQDIEVYSQELNDLKDKLREKNIAYNREKDKLFNKLNIYRKKEEFCDNAIAVANNVAKELEESSLDVFKPLLNETFRNIHWKDFKSINFTLEGEFDIIDNNGYSFNWDDLSMAELFILALSLIITLQKFYKINLPMIFDTPLARLDENARRSVMEALLKLSNEKQIILFFSSPEFTKDIQDMLRNDVVKNYDLELLSSEIGKESQVILNEK